MEEIICWFHERNLKITPDYLSPTGFIEPGVCAGFIYATDSNFVIFESFISNPHTTKEQRRAALERVVAEMIIEAKEMGYKQAFGFAVSPTMINIGMEQGFKKVEQCTTIVKSLR